jgi:hypothetical protein
VEQSPRLTNEVRCQRTAQFGLKLEKIWLDWAVAPVMS